MGHKGLLLYKGKSELNGEPIIAVATLRSENRKTGDMVQVWIIREDMLPTQAAKRGLDDAVCGDCIHRGDGTGKGRSCYVNLGQGPRAVYNGYHKGLYPKATNALLREYITGRKVRIGAYGDPAAVPIHIWDKLLTYTSKWTAYTHQWKQSTATEYKRICMASCDSPGDAELAKAAGWRYFRVSLNDQKQSGEILCPASPEGGNRRQCETCLACNGCKRDSDQRVSIVIIGHGGLGVLPNLKRNLENAK